MINQKQIMMIINLFSLLMRKIINNVLNEYSSNVKINLGFRCNKMIVLNVRIVVDVTVLHEYL